MTELSPSSSRPARLGIVDDDDAVRRSLARMLRACGFEVMTFDSAFAFLATVRTDPPDALLLDLRMPGADGLSLVDQLQDRGYTIPTVFLSGHADVPSSVRAIRAGAVDFLEKPCDEATLLAALSRAVDVGRSSRGGDEELRGRWRSLTPRERQVCRLVVQGRLNKQIAATLGTGEKTIKVHRARGMSKLGAGSVVGLVRLLDRLGEGDSFDSALPVETDAP